MMAGEGSHNNAEVLNCQQQCENDVIKGEPREQQEPCVKIEREKEGKSSRPLPVVPAAPVNSPT